MVTFFTYLALLLQFWKEIKILLKLLEKTPKEKRAELMSSLEIASKKADSGDTSAYENIIKRGR